MNAPLLSQIKESDLTKVAIFSGAVVDPDGLASSLAMQAIIESLGGQGVCFYRGTFNRSQNKTMRQSLGLTLKNVNEFDPDNGWTLLISVDGPSSVCPTLPDFIIDHHEQTDPGRKGSDVRPIGSASAILWEYAQEAELDFTTEEGGRLATALAIGITTDTRWGAEDASSDLDFEALAFCLRHKDNKLYRDILNYPEPAYYNDLHKIGWDGKVKGEAALVTGLGDLPAGRSGAISDLADRYHRTEGITLAMVFALVDDTIHASLRHSRGSLMEGEFMGEIFGCGGGKRGSAAAQIPLPEAFHNIPKELREQLFAAIKEIIVHKTLKAAGDGARDHVVTPIN